MADPTGNDPQADPIGQASVAVASSNIKTFGDIQLQYANLALGNAISNQQRMESFTMSVLARATDMMLDKTANTVAEAVLDQQGAKIAQTTPPDTSGALASLAAQVSALTQILQGLNLSPSSSPSKA
jgi:hypothetical protein